MFGPLGGLGLFGPLGGVGSFGPLGGLGLFGPLGGLGSFGPLGGFGLFGPLGLPGVLGLWLLGCCESCKRKLGVPAADAPNATNAINHPILRKKGTIIRSWISR